MSRYIATRAIRGANALVAEAEVMVERALEERGGDTPVSFPNTAYHLPLILGMTGKEIETLGQLPRRSTGLPIWGRPSTVVWPR
jgi:acetyl-CoA synthase